MSRNMQHINRRQFSTGVAVAATASAIAGRGALAQDATPEGAGASPVTNTSEVQIEVLATGLQDPRFIAIDGDAVYFTESGVGGETEVHEVSGEGTPEPTAPVSMRGTTGKLSRLEADGSVTVVADGFQSYTFGGNGEIVGPAGLALDGAGKAYVAVGAPGPFITSIELTGEEGALVEVDLETGEKRVVANLIQHEIGQDPDPMTVDSNVYGVAFREGVAYVADAGGNDVLAVDVTSGEIATFAVTGGIPVPFLGDAGNPLRGGEGEIDSVPSGIAFGPDDRIYVTYVTGGPFPAGFASVDAFTLDGQRAVFAGGLTMLGDIAFASDGTAYATIMSTDMINGGPGQVVRLSEDGAHTVVVDGLQLPNGLAFDADDSLYVVNKASFFPVGGGELLRITGVTTAIGYPFTLPGVTETADATPLAETSDAPKAVHIQMGDMFYEPAELSMPANTDVIVTFENVGFMQHDLYIPEPEVNSGVLGGGQTAELVVNLPAGTYEFWCTQVGHREAGMIGTLTVE